MKRRRGGTGARPLADDELRRSWRACVDACVADAAGGSPADCHSPQRDRSHPLARDCRDRAVAYPECETQDQEGSCRAVVRGGAHSRDRTAAGLARPVQRSRSCAGPLDSWEGDNRMPVRRTLRACRGTASGKSHALSCLGRAFVPTIWNGRCDRSKASWNGPMTSTHDCGCVRHPRRRSTLTVVRPAMSYR